MRLVDGRSNYAASASILITYWMGGAFLFLRPNCGDIDFILRHPVRARPKCPYPIGPPYIFAMDVPVAAHVVEKGTKSKARQHGSDNGHPGARTVAHLKWLVDCQ